MPLTPDQRDVLWGKNSQPIRGLYLLSARPGTGKTTTLTEYCIDVVQYWQSRYQSWQGMAVLSYTNVAKDELELKIRRLGKANSLLSPPHFVGTLDAFINQKLFLPFGAPVMQYTGARPTLVGEPHRQWKSSWSLHNTRPNGAYAPLFFDCYSIGLDGIPFLVDSMPRQVKRDVWARAKKVTCSNVDNILSMKTHVWRNGMALQSDAVYIAYQALLASAELTKALVGRFPVLVIDEAQDMTEIQHALIDHLVAAGHEHVILVGDENQAIYEWNTARPQLFVTKTTSRPWRARALTESFRCSPAICTALTALANDGVELAAAIGAKNATYSAPIDIKSYDLDHEIEAVRNTIVSVAQWLSGRLPHNDNPRKVKSIAILARSTIEVQRLRAEFANATINDAERPVWEYFLTREFVKVVHQLKLGNIYGAVGAYEALLVRAGDYDSIADMRSAHKAQQGFSRTDTFRYRLTLFRDLAKIADSTPNTTQLKISDCGVCCDATLALLNRTQLLSIRGDCHGFTGAKVKQNQLLSNLFIARDERLWLAHPGYEDVEIMFSTAHGVKGETYDAVIFVTKKRVFQCGCPDSATSWTRILDHRMIECETKRIAYVALSRAAQRLVILAPADAIAEWQSHTT